MKAIKLIHIWLIGLLTCGHLQAQTEFTATVKSTTVGLNERFSIRFTLNASGHTFKAPSFSDFRVLGGPSRSQSTNIINGAMSMESSWSFVLMPRQTGTYTIASASVISDGKTYRTEPIRIKVTKSSPRSEDPNDPQSRAAKNAFIRVLASKTSLYVGEPLVASYKLYFTSRVNSPNLIDEPDFTGFYKEVIDLGNIDTRREMFRGKSYNTAVVRQMVLIPQRSGTIKPGEVVMDIPTMVSSNQRDIFGRRVGQMVNQSSRNQFPAISVKPLPSQGRPDNFSGAVGSFDMKAEVSRSELGSDESLTLRITISGRGNIGLIDLPKPKLPSAFEVFDPEVSEKVTTNAAGMSGRKVYEYLLVPRYGGEYKIPEIKFSYFDPNSQRYRTITEKEKLIKVSGDAGPEGTTTGVAPASKENVDYINREILSIKNDPGELRSESEAFYGSTRFYALLILLGLSLLGMISVFVIRANRRENLGELKSQKASKQAKKQLSSAKKHLKEENTEAFYLALSNALWGYFADKMKIPQGQLSKELIAEKLDDQGVEPTVIDEITETMNRAEMARFSGLKQTNAEEDYEKTALLLTKIDRKL